MTSQETLRQRAERIYGVAAEAQKGDLRSRAERIYGVEPKEPEGGVLGLVGRQAAGGAMEQSGGALQHLERIKGKIKETVPATRFLDWPAELLGRLTGAEDGQVLEQAGSALVEAAPPPEPGMLAKGARITGGVAPLLVPGMAAARTGRAAGFILGVPATGARIGGAVGAGLAGVAAKGDQEFDAARARALEGGATPEAADRHGWKASIRASTLVSGLSEGLPLEGIIGRLGSVFYKADKRSGGFLKRAFFNLFKEMPAEAVQEAGDEFASILNENLDAKDRKTIRQLLAANKGRLAKAGLWGAAAVGPWSLIATAVEGGPPTKPQGLEGLEADTDAEPAPDEPMPAGTPPTVAGEATKPPPILSQTEEGRAMLDRLAAEAEKAAPGPNAGTEAAPTDPTEDAPSVAPPVAQEQAQQPEVAGAPETALGSAQAEHGPRPTSIKKATVAQELAALDLPPAAVGGKVTEDGLRAYAEQAFARDPHIGERLLGELARSNRPHSAEEAAVLLWERNRIGLKRAQAQTALDAARQGGTQAEVRSAEQVVEDIAKEYAAASDITGRAGTATAQGLAVRQMMMNQDYSLAEHERQAISENHRRLAAGDVTTEQLRTEMKGLTDMVMRLDAAFQKQVAADEVKTAQKEARVAARTRKRDVLLERLGKEADAARARIKARRESGTTMLYAGGIDTPGLIDETIIGAHYVAKGLVNFADWSEAMVKEFGEGIRKHLPGIFEQAQARVDDTDVEDAIARLTATKEKLQARLALNDIAPRGKKALPDDPRAKALAAEVGALLSELRQRQQAAKTDEQRDAAASKAAITRSVMEARRIEARIASGDFSPTPPRKIHYTPEALDALAKAERAKKLLAQKHREYVAANRTTGEKVQAWTKDIATGGLRALQFGHDISVIFQQALVATLQNPKAAATQALPKALKALASEARMDRIDAELRSRPLYQISTDAGLKLLDPDGPAPERAEFFASELLRKVPTIAAFERAVTTYRNVIAATTFDSMYMAIPGTPTAEQAQDIAGAVNVFVGYGTGSTAEGAAHLNNVFNAPRLYVSQFQTLLSPLTLAMSPLGLHVGVTARSGQVRRIIAGRLARALGGAAAMYALGVAAGGELEKDPRSSVGWRLVFTDKETGKKTVLAPLGGLTTALTFLARLTGKTKDAETGKLRGTSFYDIYSFAGYKLAPWLGNGFSFAVGKTPMGDPYNFKTKEGLRTVAKSTVIPIAFSDVIENMEANGIPKALAFQLVNMLGQSVYVKEHGGSSGPPILE